MKVKLSISLILAFLAFLFVYQNTEVVKVQFLMWDWAMSLVLLVFIMLGSGIIIGWSLSSYLRFMRNRKWAKGEAVQKGGAAVQDAPEVAPRGDD